ncbi:Uncharacterised BCR, YnfA/UPF0060 family [Raoultella terrigena]|uniref:Uncharacterized BCR, YnfA/UPF0060 family n=1 Tax=Raoultella terrigena TaxID=577 RepID=A0A4U9D1F5_RAOTE|nr:Uncharacterised BCR, YnfA/UPF0060 family [Raoultella terrigena]
MFVWLLTLQPGSERTRLRRLRRSLCLHRAAVAALLLTAVKLSHYDWAGAVIALCGMLIIVAGWGRA